MEITKKEIKERLYELGADLCGIAGCLLYTSDAADE